MADFLRRAGGWLLDRPGCVLLGAGEERLSRQDPSRFARAWLGIMAQSLVWGLVLTNVWGLAWWIFGGPAPFIMPAAATLSVFVLGPFRRSMVAWLDLCAENGASSRPVLAAMFVVGLGLCFMCLSAGPYKVNEFPSLPWWLSWVRPEGTLHRILLLMPVWGGWSMLITPQFCRAGGRTDPVTASFAKGCGAATAAGCLVVPLAGTLFYFHYVGLAGQVTISAVAALAAIASGLACCRRAGGLCRRSLLGANFLTQVAFLLACLGCR
jgi:hypothetical protein